MKRQVKKKTICTLLALVLFMGVMGEAVYAGSLGTEIFSKSLSIGERTVLANGVYWNSSANDRMTENYIVYEPGGTVVPAVAYGNDIYGAASLKAVVNMAKERGQHVIAGLNGDFFNMSNGVAIGPVIKDSILRTSESSRYQSIGFYKDGSAFISRMNLNIRVDGPNFSDGIGGIHLNKMVTLASGPILYSDDYEASTKATIPTINAVLTVDGKPSINGRINATVESVTEAVGAVAIPDGKMVLTTAKDSSYTTSLNRIKGLKPGDTLTLSFAADQAWNNVVMAIGGETKLITGGTIVAPSTGREPRTAVGIKRDGTVVFYTVDGRQTGHSIGCTMYEVAARLQELGCVEAINLDGGGSTTLQGIYPGEDALTTVNSPSGSALRSCGNYILLINTQPRTGVLTHLQPYPYEFRLLAGAQQQLSVKAADSAYYAMATPANLEYDVDEELGEIDENGLFTAGRRGGKGTISITSGEAYGESRVTVIETPDRISILDQSTGKAITSLAITGGKSYDLSASATFNTMPLISRDDCYTWTVTGDIGTIDDKGVFTAAKVSSGTGKITATAGGASASVTVTGMGNGQLLEGFEGTSYKLWVGSTNPLTVKATQDMTKVRYGWKSLSAVYDFNKTGSESLAIPSTITFSQPPGILNFWVYGDKSGNTLSVKGKGADGTEREYSACTLDFSGWRQVSVNLNSTADEITSLNINYKSTKKGSVYFDQFMACNGQYLDLTPPSIQLDVTGQTLTATITDNMDKELAASDLQLTYDGKSTNFTFDGTTMRATLPAADGKTHRVAVIAADESGNIARKTVSLTGASMEQPFADMGKHWAREYTSYLYSQGIVNGTKTGTGFLYKPDVNMTRTEFAVIMSNWLVPDTSAYADVTLPFADAASIPKWARDAVKAMYSKGIIQGSSTGGKLYFRPDQSITRQEAMTIIGRTQPRGYTEANLTFSDSNQVENWALPYIKPMVSQGIISGSSDGKLYPLSPVTRAQVAKIIYEMN